MAESNSRSGSDEGMPGSDEGMLELLGFTTTTGAAMTRRELRERERSAASRGSRPAGPRGADAPREVSAAERTTTGRATTGRAKPRGRADDPAPRASRAPASRGGSARSGARSGPGIGARLLSLGAMVFAAALAVGMSVPATVFSNSSAQADPSLASIVVGQSQSVEMSAAAAEVAAATGRDEWTVLSWAEVLKQRYGNRDYSYSVGNGPIRWPFPVAVRIASGYGERVAPCYGCSSTHMGVDFDPGDGAAVFAIADGVVTVHEDGTGGLGNYVTIEHQIDGHVVTSTYAHMQHGSVPLNPGDAIQVGDFVGLVGQTGTATGPHLHLEITVDGVHVDPFTFLTHYAS